MSFYFNIPPGNRPPDGSFYLAFAQSTDGAGTWGGLSVGLCGDANGDYVKLAWGNNIWQSSISYPRGQLFDGNPHFVQITADPYTPGNTTRSINYWVDIGQSSQQNNFVSGGANVNVTSAYSYIGGMKGSNGAVVNGMAGGRIGHFAFYNNNTADPFTTTDDIGRWQISRYWGNIMGGTHAMFYLASWVNPSYLPYLTGDSGYALLPFNFQNANGLTLLQDTAKDLEGAYYFTRYGHPGWKTKSQIDTIWLNPTSQDDIQWVSWAWNMGPDPGYQFESDIANVYTVVKGSQGGGSNISYSATQADMRRQYGYREYKFSSNLAYGSDIQTRTQTLLSRYSAPITRVSDTTWDIAANEYLSGAILRLDLTSVLNIAAWPADSPWSSANFSVQRIAHRVAVNGACCDWETVLALQKVGG
jgi:hypothetical protein